MGAQCNKVGAVATGEVFFLDIGLLIGAIRLTDLPQKSI